MRRRALTAILLASVTAGVATGAEWHAAPGGRVAATGSEADPWNLQTALANPTVVLAGDTIWVHGGEYVADKPFVVKLKGEEGKPIIVRNWRNSRATLRAPLHLGVDNPFPTQHVWIWGIEIQTAGGPVPKNPVNIGNSTFAAGHNPGIKLINCIVHDSPLSGMGNWGSAEEEIYGCLVYHNGSDGNPEKPNERGYGHGFYIQSKTHKEFRDNIVFRNFFLGFQIYGSAASEFNNITMEGNTFFNNGEISLIQSRRKEFPQGYIKGGRTVVNPRLIENCFYSPGWAVKATVSMGDTENALVQGNYMVSPGPDKRVALDITSLKGGNRNLKMADNTFIGMIVGFAPDQYGTGNVHLPARPTSGTKVFMRRNAYEEGRANIAIFNWECRPEVRVDVSAAGLKAGDRYEVRDVQDWFGKPVATGTYEGNPVTIPMTGLTVAPPVGRSAEYKAPPHTAPEFGAFVIMRAAIE